MATQLPVPQEEDDIQAVVAIDVGTTRTGFGYCITSLGEVLIKQEWGHGSPGEKTITSVLLDEQNNFKAFGQEARFAYYDMTEEERQVNSLFECFKMSLFFDPNRQPHAEGDEPMARAMNGRMVPTMQVFAAILKHIKSMALAQINRGPIHLALHQIRWVLTVPAIWSEAAKQKMRIAAFQAGLVEHPASKNLYLALEPEAASLSCRKEVLKMQADFDPGTKYCVLDCGGGTVDITVHEALEGGFAKEIRRPAGGDWGATYVDQSFFDWLGEIFGHDHLDHLQGSFSSDLLETQEEWEKVKTRIKHSDTMQNKKNIQLASFLLSYGGNQAQCVAQYNEANADHAIQLRGTRLGVPVSKLLKFFVEQLSHISQHMEQLMNEIPDIKYIFLVGGFSECDLMKPYLMSSLRLTEDSPCTIVRPMRPGLAVIHGAVLFGLNPRVITHRIARCAYGIESMIPYVPGQFPPDCRKVVGDDGQSYVEGFFSRFVSMNEEIPNDHRVIRTYIPFRKDLTTVKITLFTANDNAIQLVKDCRRMASINVEVPQVHLEPNQKPVRVIMSFGSTNMSVVAENALTNDRQNVHVEYHM